MTRIVRPDQSGFAALGSIYDAAVDRALWVKALDATALVGHAKAAILMITDVDDQLYEIQAMGSAWSDYIDSGVVAHYLEHYRHMEAAEWEAIKRTPVQKILFDSDVGDPAVLDQRRDYVFAREKLGIRRRLGFRLSDNKAWQDVITLQYGCEDKAIPKSVVPRLQPLLPHLAKSIEMGRVFVRLRERYKAVLAAIDHVDVGLAIARGDGECIVINRAAERILSTDDGIGLSSQHRIWCEHPNNAAMIAEGIAKAADTSRGEGNDPENLIVVERPSGHHPFMVEIAPLRDSMDEIDRNAVGALVTIIDPHDVRELEIGRFARMYKLSKAEADVCEMMVAGLTGSAIADRRNTSQETVKSQMKSIFTKAGVKRRTELIRLALRALPPVR